MLFNSFDFLLFFPIVVILYWVLPHRFRNPMLLLASYYFYMNWEPVYALLILFSTVTTWGCGMLIGKGEKGGTSVDDTGRKSRRWLSLCIVLNICILFTYKYLEFIGNSIHDLFLAVGIAIPIPHFELLLPVGISFYTFQAIGYIVDVYRGDIKPERNFFTYALFVSFFPQLVAGPIERAKNLLPQFHTVHRFNGDNMIDGLKMMAWGYFMKLCIADSVAPYVNAVFNNIDMHNGKTIWLASFMFTFQIFCDFAGYSLIAIGTARCVNFRLMQNFRQPYLSRNVKEFWRRWHISLSSWLSDYIYKPLGGSRVSDAKHHRNLLITFLASGLWHGANWTFVVWGAYHGVLQSLHKIGSKIKKPAFYSSKTVTVLGVLGTFVLVLLGWVLFRANSLSDAMTAYRKMLHPSGMLYNGEGKPAIVLPLLMILILMAREIRNELEIKLRLTSNQNLVISGMSTACLIFLIILCANFDGGQFIYFQF